MTPADKAIQAGEIPCQKSSAQSVRVTPMTQESTRSSRLIGVAVWRSADGGVSAVSGNRTKTMKYMAIAFRMPITVKCISR